MATGGSSKNAEKPPSFKSLFISNSSLILARFLCQQADIIIAPTECSESVSRCFREAEIEGSTPSTPTLRLIDFTLLTFPYKLELMPFLKVQNPKLQTPNSKNWNLGIGHWSLKRGFTLIEILVAITILSIVTSVGTVSFNNSLDKGRDSKRKQDLAAIKSAATLYFEENGQYPPDPAVNSGTTFTSDAPDPWIPGLTPTYIQELPKDPKQARLPIFLALAELTAEIFNKITISPVLADTAGPKSPSIVGSAGDDCIYNRVYKWKDSNNVISSNNAYSTLDPAVGNNSKSSYFLKATGFGFSIPSNALINGVRVQVEARRSSSSFTYHDCVLLVVGGTPQGGDRSTHSELSTADRYDSFGGSTDLWGLTLTPDDINRSDFGVGYSVFFDTPADGIDVYLDHIRISVYYTIPAYTTPYSTPYGTPYATPPVAGGCAGKTGVYCYIVSADRSSYTLWAQLGNSSDPEIYNKPSATCTNPPPDNNYNYCLKPD